MGGRIAELRKLEIGPLAPLTALSRHHYLLSRIVAQDLKARYRESILGFVWALILPLAQLAVFTFVFGTIIPARWPSAGLTPLDFPLVLFCGIIMFTAFAEAITRAPTTLVEGAVYIKRVVFPVQILPVSTVAVAMVNLVFAIVLLIAGSCLAHGRLPQLEILYIPVIICPFALLLLGLCWLLSAAGLYLQDLRHAISPVVSLLLFLSPILYPPSAVPEKVRSLLYFNPITVPVEQLRAVVIYQVQPDLQQLTIYALVAWLIAWAGYAWFVILRRGFADVV